MLNTFTALDSQTRFEPVRWLAVLLVLTQWGLWGLLSGSQFEAIVFAAVTVLSLVTPWRFRPSPRVRFWLLSIAIILLLVKYFLFPPQLNLFRPFVRSEVTITLAEILLALQTVQLFLIDSKGRLARHLPAFAIFAIVFTLNMHISPGERPVVMSLVFTSVVLVGLCYWFGRDRVGGSLSHTGPHGVIALLVIIGSVFGTAWVSAESLYRYEQTLDGFLLDILRPDPSQSSVGFSRRSRLGTVKNVQSQDSEAIALRVDAETSPGYLRGQVFVTYRGVEWFSRREKGSKYPVRRGTYLPVDSRAGDSVFELFPLPVAQGRQLSIRQEVGTGGPIFLPRDTAFLAAPVQRVLHEPANTVEIRDLEAGLSYRAFEAENRPAETLDPDDRRELLEVPTDLDPRVRKLARELFADSETAPEKLRTVMRHFHLNYEYQFGIDIPPETDPLTHFLLERPPAHCEYFATGSALLLRLAGVPTRYVTGFVAAEQNGFTRQWIARNQHAHAWVEAYVDGYGWVTVEATPSAGRPQTIAQAPTRRQFTEALEGWWRSIRERWQYGGWTQIRSDLLTLFLGPIGWILGAYLLYRIVRRYRRRGTETKEMPLSEPYRRLQKLLTKLLGQLERGGLQPAAGETLTCFATRLRSVSVIEGEPVADWLDRYIALRYRPQLHGREIETLRAEFPKVERSREKPQHQKADDSRSATTQEG